MFIPPAHSHLPALMPIAFEFCATRYHRNRRQKIADASLKPLARVYYLQSTTTRLNLPYQPVSRNQHGLNTLRITILDSIL